MPQIVGMDVLGYGWEGVIETEIETVMEREGREGSREAKEKDEDKSLRRTNPAGHISPQSRKHPRRLALLASFIGHVSEQFSLPMRI